MSFALWTYPGADSFSAIADAQFVPVNRLPEEGAFVLKPFRSSPFYILQAKKEEIADPVKWLAEQPWRLPDSKAIHSTKKADFIRGVSKAIAEIKSDSELRKVVLSRVEEMDFVFEGEIIRRLKEAYPQAFVALVHDERLGSWLMASPELFLSRAADTFTSFSLAGTGYHEHQLGSKEEEEQNFVTRFIRTTFNQILGDARIAGRERRQSGPVHHWLNKVSAETPASSEEVEELLENLHPTPAVGGWPKASALEYISGVEGYPRELYTGYLGYYSSKNNFSFYVNLRCAQLFSDSSLLYAGAGITAESEAEKEWTETELKMKALTKYFGR